MRKSKFKESQIVAILKEDEPLITSGVLRDLAAFKAEADVIVANR